MTVTAFIGVILWIFIQAVLWQSNKDHIAKTGVPAPSRKAMARIRRSARQKGVSQDAAYDQWLVNKRQRMPRGALLPPADRASPVTPTLPSKRPGPEPIGAKAESGAIAVLAIVVVLFLGIMFLAVVSSPKAPTDSGAQVSAPGPERSSQPEPALPRATPASFELPKLDDDISSRLLEATPHRVSVTPSPIAPRPVSVAETPLPRRVADPPAAHSRARGGCGSRGGPGYRLANGRCASWSSGRRHRRRH